MEQIQQQAEKMRFESDIEVIKKYSDTELLKLIEIVNAELSSRGTPLVPSVIE